MRNRFNNRTRTHAEMIINWNGTREQKHQNTLVYTQLVEFKNDGFTFKGATIMQQVCNLVE